MAKNWIDIYRDLRPEEPLTPDDPKLYKNLFGNLVDNIAIRLSTEKDKNQKVLFSGNGGCGKSTFVNLLEQHPIIKDQFFTVSYTIKDILDINDATYIDLLLSLTLQTFIKITEKESIKIKKDLLKKVQDFALSLAGVIEREEIIETKKGKGIGIWLQKYLFAYYRNEKATREKIRQYYKPRITDFLNTINDILDRIQFALKNKHLLILIDDTDKIPPDKAHEVFFDNGQYLSIPHSNILFVIGTDITSSSQYPIVVKKIGEEEFFPAIKIIEKNETQSEITKKNYNLFRELVYKRIPKEFIENSALNKAIEMSGGVVRELIRILREAIFFAKGKIRDDHIDKARMKIFNQYNLMGYVPTLKKILENPTWPNTLDEEEAKKVDHLIRELLYMPALFQYRNNEEKWYRPYPIFIEWLKKLD